MAELLVDRALRGEAALDAAQEVLDAAEGGLEVGAVRLLVELLGFAEHAGHAVGHVLAVADHRAAEVFEFVGQSINLLLAHHDGQTPDERAASLRRGAGHAGAGRWAAWGPRLLNYFGWIESVRSSFSIGFFGVGTSGFLAGH